MLILKKNIPKYDELKKRFFLKKGIKFQFVSNIVITFNLTCNYF